MPNRNHETMNRQLYKAFEQLTPDEDAKDRMYAKMMRRATSPPAKKKAWYQHWQFSAGACTAALACVVVATASLHARMPESGTEGLQVVTPATTADQASDADTPVQTVLTESIPADSQSVLTTTVSQTETKAKSSGTAVSDETWVETPASESELAVSEVIGATNSAVQTKPTQETVPVKTTTVSTVYTTTAPPEKPSHTTTAASEGPVEVTTEPAATTNVPVRQNIYLYYQLNWDGSRYNTQYEQLPSHTLGDYLGYSVTRGADVDDTYTVLIYEIVGVDSTQQLAVQYAGEDSYYLFTVG